MVVIIRLPGILRDLAHGRATVPVELPEPATVGDVFDRLAVAFPALERRIRDECGAVRQHVNVFLGDTNVRRTRLSATPATDGAEILVLPCISGG